MCSISSDNNIIGEWDFQLYPTLNPKQRLKPLHEKRRKCSSPAFKFSFNASPGGVWFDPAGAGAIGL